jgi:hypothetical protein
VQVRLLETLRHQNIVTYHHSWLETCRFSAFGPSVPTLFVLMQWAEGGRYISWYSQPNNFLDQCIFPFIA